MLAVLVMLRASERAHVVHVHLHGFMMVWLRVAQGSRFCWASEGSGLRRFWSQKVLLGLRRF